MDEGLIAGADGRTRCFWPGALPDYIRYHDTEWGFPVADDHRLFEKICLEGFQSGLSWLTILRKRENFREAFEGFEMERVARFGDADVERLMANPGIVRHRGKIASVINNARCAIKLKEEAGSLAAFFWSFEPKVEERPARIDLAALRANTTSAASVRLSKALKKRGWSFVGPTTCHAFFQAMGLVDDHLEGCFCRPLAKEARLAFTPPKRRSAQRLT